MNELVSCAVWLTLLNLPLIFYLILSSLDEQCGQTVLIMVLE